MPTLADRGSCTGCGACKAACPKAAIVMEDDAEGFPTPKIETEKCVSCGLCEKTCPALHSPERKPVLAAYAAQMLDRDALKESTSGGLFTVFSREIFRRGGVVYGCVWDKDYNAVFRRADNEEEMKPMRGSKYVWSWAGDTFPEIKGFLEGGRTVLFVGTPCQAAGLKSYLRKDYDNLFLVDFFCGGAPSPKAFQSYLKTITRDVPMERLNFKLRDKEKYGVGVNISYEGKRGRIHQSYVKNPYFFSYHTKVFHRSPCYHCQYRQDQRIEDLTIGDYWGVANYHQEFDVRAGVSALLVNTEKGAALLESVKKELQLSPTRVEDIAAGNNLSLNGKKTVFRKPAFRKAFFETMEAKGWTAAERRFLYNKTRLKLWIKTKLPAKHIKTLKKIRSAIRG